MLATTVLYFRFYIYNRDKFIRLTIFHCERTATQNINFTVVVENRRIIDFDTYLQNKFRSCCLRVFLFLHSFRLTLTQPTVKSVTQFSEKLSRPRCQQLYISEFDLRPFWATSVLK